MSLPADSGRMTEIKLVDANSWEVRRDFADGPPVYWMAFSPDGRYLAGSADLGAYVWDIAAGQKGGISPPFGGSASPVFSLDGKWVATADPDGFVRVYDPNTEALHTATALPTLLEPMTAAFSPNGETLLAGGVDKAISFIEAASGKVSRTMAKQPGLVFSLSVSHDGKHAAVVYRSAERFMDINHLRLLDLEKRNHTGRLPKAGNHHTWRNLQRSPPPLCLRVPQPTHSLVCSLVHFVSGRVRPSVGRRPGPRASSDYSRMTGKLPTYRTL